VVRKANLDQRTVPDGGLPRVELPLSNEVSVFLSAVGRETDHDPASVAALLLDRLVRDPGCLKKVLGVD
jgi:hypothetical protein